jgi:hypothetical protein
MEERKTAAIVLSILGLIFIFFVFILPYINLKKDHELNYKNCKVSFRYAFSIDTTDDGYIAGQHKLGLCLCDSYHIKKDRGIEAQIIKIYSKYGIPISQDKLHNSMYNKLDSIMKYRKKAFDTVIVVD